MERLTETRHGDTMLRQCFDYVSPACGVNCGQCDHETQAIARLAEYEDTGLTPAQVSRMKTDYHRALSLAKEAHKLLLAKADDRLLVLPCAIGTPVYTHDTVCSGQRSLSINCKYGRDCQRNPHIKCPIRVVKRPFALLMYKNLGKTFWMTPEEAEAAIPASRRYRP